MDALLHTGTEHPDLIWIVAAAIVSFVAGTGLGAYLLKPRLESDTDSEATTAKN